MRRTKVVLAAVSAMAVMMATAVPTIADHLDLGPVLCSDYITGIPENPPLCVVDTSSIPAGESFQCANVLYEVADVTGPFCVVDGGIDISYLVPLGG